MPATAMTIPARAVVRHYVVFLDGISSHQALAPTPNDVMSDFRDIRAGLVRALGPSTQFIYFSYSAAGAKTTCAGWTGCDIQSTPIYTTTDTHIAIDQQAQTLDVLLTMITAADPQSKIDLVGYSLGGIVAARWAALLGTGNVALHVHDLILLDSPVGGFPLAGAYLAGCGSDVRCNAWSQSRLPSLVGTTVLSELQLATDNATTSIVPSLPQAARNLDVTMMQSTADYLVNGTPITLCLASCAQSTAVTIGLGAQQSDWGAVNDTAYNQQPLGGQKATKAITPERARGLILDNHRAPLHNLTVISRIGVTVQRDGTLWALRHPSDVQTTQSSTAEAITEFVVPTAKSSATGITASADNTLWFTERQSNKIGQITAGGVVDYAIRTANSQPTSIAMGSDGALWFTESAGNRIGRITTSGQIKEITLQHPESAPWDIVAGPGGALWFTEEQGNRIGRIITTGNILEFAVPTTNSGPNSITVGPDGALWFTEYYGDKISRIDTNGHVKEFALPTAKSFPVGITAGPDGALWFTEAASGKIGRITTDGHITEFIPPTLKSGPSHITAGPDGALWFTEAASGKIGRITTDGHITELTLPTSSSGPGHIISSCRWRALVHGDGSQPDWPAYTFIIKLAGHLAQARIEQNGHATSGCMAALASIDVLERSHQGRLSGRTKPVRDILVGDSNHQE